MKELKGRVAVVTGAGSGIGAALARACGQEGMKVVAADVEGGLVDALVASMRDVGMQAVSHTVDVRERSAVDALADRAFGEFGACHLLCNNAGVMLSRPIIEMQERDWEWLLSVNLWGIIHALGAFLPRMKGQKVEGHVVNTASIAGIMNFGSRGLGAYSTTKAAVVALSEFLRAELEVAGVPIGVSVVCPGAVATRIAESERNRPPEFDTGTSKEASDVNPNSSEVPGMQSPEEVATRILAGVRNNEGWILTHPEMKPMVETRTRALLTAFGVGEPGDI